MKLTLCQQVYTTCIKISTGLEFEIGENRHTVFAMSAIFHPGSELSTYNV